MSAGWPGQGNFLAEKINIPSVSKIYSRIDVIDFHTLPIKYKRHASDRLKERFQMATDEVRHCLKTGKHIKKPGKGRRYRDYRKRDRRFNNPVCIYHKKPCNLYNHCGGLDHDKMSVLRY